MSRRELSHRNRLGWRAPSGWLVEKRIATNAARGHAVLGLATEHGAPSLIMFDHGIHGIHMNPQSMCGYT